MNDDESKSAVISEVEFVSGNAIFAELGGGVVDSAELIVDIGVDGGLRSIITAAEDASAEVVDDSVGGTGDAGEEGVVASALDAISSLQSVAVRALTAVVVLVEGFAEGGKVDTEDTHQNLSSWTGHF